MKYAKVYLLETTRVAGQLDADVIERMVKDLVAVRESQGRVFFVGVGGSLATAHHAVNDFRKLCGIEAYAPQAAEMTARANDDGWATVFDNDHIKSGDALFVLSVGGGTAEVSLPIVRAVNAAKAVGARVLGIVGRDGGYTKQHGNCVVVVPTVSDARVTPHTESFQSVVLHLLVSHPSLQRKGTKW